jgi:uncharacterized membrane protein (DUF4010 family)
VAVQLFTLWLGSSGVLIGAMLAGLVDLHAAGAALFAQAAAPASQAPLLVHALMLTFAVHTLNKVVFAALSGGRAYALAVLPGLLAQIAAFVGVLWWVVR